MSRVQPDTTILMQPREALVLRDARPFSSDPGSRAFSLRWPLPRTVAGAMRSHIVRRLTPNTTWDHAAATTAREFVVHGPLLVAQHEPGGQWIPHVPAPKDVVPLEDGGVMILRPDMNLPDGAGTDLPGRHGEESGHEVPLARAMKNVCLFPMGVSESGKPTPGPDFWSIQDAVHWLTATDSTSSEAALAGKANGVKGPQPKEQIHVSIDRDMNTALEGAFFTTESREYVADPVGPELTRLIKHLRNAVDDSEGKDNVRTGEKANTASARGATPALAMIARVGGSPSETWNRSSFASIGGERRLVQVSAPDQVSLWPEPVIPDEGILNASTTLRLQLVTPAIFAHGWLPGWMADGVIPGLGGCGLGVELVGVASDRPVPVSGWRLASRSHRSNDKPGKPAGPKKIERAAPAGSVYFFRITRGQLSPEIWQKLWLAPISDSEFHCNEGFGLTLPGIW